MEKITDGRYTFEIVDRVPRGYMIWNIGANMVDGYLPLCRLARHQRFPGGRDIEVDTLKAIRIPEAQVILAAIGGGQRTIEEMELYIKKNAEAKPGTWKYAQVQRMIKALPYMRQIKWD